jgi:hypothetical protein
VSLLRRVSRALEALSGSQLDFIPQADEQEAGRTVWMNQTNHYEITRTKQDEGATHHRPFHCSTFCESHCKIV